MKHIFFALVLLALSSVSRAVTLYDFQGGWYGGSENPALFSQSTVLKVNTQGNLVATTALLSEGNAFWGTGTYRKDGTYSGVLFLGGSVVGVSTGRWILSGNMVWSVVTTQTVSGVETTNAFLQLKSYTRLEMTRNRRAKAVVCEC
jgi:hypothetical protein